MGRAKDMALFNLSQRKLQMLPLRSDLDDLHLLLSKLGLFKILRQEVVVKRFLDEDIFGESLEEFKSEVKTLQL
ncbi:hypothetical protein RIF29_39493 [Crotalaria pallida]|uniref:Uncharacterized protein n=1 Tax=Crotalaria pallida TaxID=3830 RepID=A0AAN9HTC5_CROPI